MLYRLLLPLLALLLSLVLVLTVALKKYPCHVPGVYPEEYESMRCAEFYRTLVEQAYIAEKDGELPQLFAAFFAMPDQPRAPLTHVRMHLYQSGWGLSPDADVRAKDIFYQYYQHINPNASQAVVTWVYGTLRHHIAVRLQELSAKRNLGQ
jgi:hypothetical protein